MRVILVGLLPLALAVAVPEPTAAPVPTPPAKLEQRQISIALPGGGIVVSDGLICGAVFGLSGCLGSSQVRVTGTSGTISGTINSQSARITGPGLTAGADSSGFSVYRETTSTRSTAGPETASGEASDDAALPMRTPAVGAALLGVGGLMLGML